MRICVVGGYGVGMTMRLDHAPEAGETVADGILSVGPGGKGSNQAIACARLGAEVSLFTAVGADAPGRDALRLWSAEGVGQRAVQKSSPTMTGFILLDESGENRIAVAPGALAELEPTDLESFEAVILGAEVLLVSLEVPMAVAVRALGLAHDAGVATVLNPAPARPLPAEAWGMIDYLTPNAGEGHRLLASSDVQADEVTAGALSDRGGGVVVMTRGARPTLVHSPTEVFQVEPPRVDRVRDTTGAGDAFSAAFAVALAEGLELAPAVEFANAAGALSVGVPEVVPSLPLRLDVEEHLRRQRGTVERP
jgi:ribokinase